MIRRLGAFLTLLAVLVSMLPAGALCCPTPDDDGRTAQIEDREPGPSLSLDAPASPGDDDLCPGTCDCLCACRCCPAHATLAGPIAMPLVQLHLATKHARPLPGEDCRSRDPRDRVFHPPRSMHT